MARLRYDDHQKHYFDSKIEMWSIVYREPTQRNSKNRVKGAIRTKNVESLLAVR